MLAVLSALKDMQTGGSPSKPTKFTLKADQKDVTIYGHLNPTDLTIKRNAKWDTQCPASADGGAVRPIYKYLSGDDTLTFTFTLDTSESPNDLSDELEVLYDLSCPTQTEQDKYTRPPIVYFSWGNFSFQGIVQDVDMKVTLFSPKGHMKRASVTLTMKGDAFAKEERVADEFMETPIEKTAQTATEETSGVAGGGMAELGRRMGRII